MPQKFSASMRRHDKSTFLTLLAMGSPAVTAMLLKNVFPLEVPADTCSNERCYDVSTPTGVPLGLDWQDPAQNLDPVAF